MSLSDSVLELVREDSDPVYLIAYLLDSLRRGFLPPIESADERDASEEGRTLVRGLIERTIKARLEARFAESSDENIFERGILPDLPANCLDEYFTVDMLTRVPDVVKRWQHLRDLMVASVPGEHVHRRLAEAGRCYLYGIYNGTAVLCRATLEFALQERAGTLGGATRFPETLEAQIDWAHRNGLLPDANRAHRVRTLGNQGVHLCWDGIQYCKVTQSQAREAMRITGSLLAHLYGEAGARE